MTSSKASQQQLHDANARSYSYLLPDYASSPLVLQELAGVTNPYRSNQYDKNETMKFEVSCLKATLFLVYRNNGNKII